MNNIEQIIANAQQNTQAHEQASAEPMQQAAGQDFQQAPAQTYEQAPQQQPVQQTYEHAPQQQPVQQTYEHAPQQTQYQQTYEQAPQQQPVQQPQQQPQYQQPQQPVQQPQYQQPQQAMQGQLMPQQTNPMGSMMEANLPPEILALVSQGPKTMSMDTMASSDLACQDWLKPDYHGMVLGSKPNNILGKIVVDIDMRENAMDGGYLLCEMVRWTVAGPNGNQTMYVHTFDGIKGSDNQPWVNAVTTAYRASPNPQKPITPYRCVMIPMRLVEDIIGKQDPRDPNSPNVVLCKAGTMIGYTSPASGWRAWEDFYKTVRDANLLGQKVRATAENQPVAPQGSGYKWGIVDFEFMGPAPAKTEQQPQQQAPQQQHVQQTYEQAPQQTQYQQQAAPAAQ